MKIPSKITPCPIVEAIMEIRFESKQDEDAVFGIIYNSVKDDYEKIANLPILNLPFNLRKSDPNLIYLPYFRLESKTNKSILIQVGPRVLSIAVTGEYPGWSYFQDHIKYILRKVHETDIVSKGIRISLRYINFFKENILTKLTLSIKLGESELNPNNSNLRLEIPAGDFTNLLTISNPAIRQDESGIFAGSIIDIDTTYSGVVPLDYDKQLEIINNCHREEKKLFYSLLSQKYLDTLKEVKYD